jgi:predicted N-acetyltransferase YhbS
MDDCVVKSPDIALKGAPETVPLDAANAAAAEALILQAFGPGRFAKTAERLREGNIALKDLSFAALSEGQMVGCVRTWPIMIKGQSASAPRLCFLGPIAVAPSQRDHGIGGRLIKAVIDAARTKGFDAVILVGDMAYFARFGFEPAVGLSLPGPVDHNRLLMARLGVNAKWDGEWTGCLEAGDARPA